MVRKADTDVLIVGAGPTGLLAANVLVARGLEMVVVDQDWRTAAHSYAVAIHPDSLDLLARLGLADELVALGHKLATVGFYEGETCHARLDYSRHPSGRPYLLVAPQSALEGVLEARLQEAHRHVDWNHRLESIEEQERACVARVARLDKVTSGYPIARTEWEISRLLEIRASYLIGADGYSSFTRRHLGIDYERFGELVHFAVFEIELDRTLEHEARVILDEDQTSFFLPMGERRCRWAFQVDHVPERGRPEAGDLASRLDRHGSWFRARPAEIRWSSYVGFDQRLAAQFGRGRVWLAGDAGHMTGPIGAQSINTGLREAWSLAGILADILRGDASPERLEGYARQGHAEWARRLGSGRVRARSEASEWVKSRADRILPCVAATGAALDELLGQIGLELATPA